MRLPARHFQPCTIAISARCCARRRAAHESGVVRRLCVLSSFPNGTAVRSVQRPDRGRCRPTRSHKFYGWPHCSRPLDRRQQRKHARQVHAARRNCCSSSGETLSLILSCLVFGFCQNSSDHSQHSHPGSHTSSVAITPAPQSSIFNARVAAGAIGLRTTKDLAPWLRPDVYPPIPPEGEDDWPRGRGQTFDDYVAEPNKAASSSSKKVTASTGRSKIYLQPLGDTTDSFPDLSALSKGCTAFFGLPTEVLPLLTLKQLEAKGHTRITVAASSWMLRPSTTTSSSCSHPTVLRFAPSPCATSTRDR